MKTNTEQLSAAYRAIQQELKELREQKRLTAERKYVVQLKQEAETTWRQLLACMGEE